MEKVKPMAYHGGLSTKLAEKKLFYNGKAYTVNTIADGLNALRIAKRGYSK